jgi:hypothetical protein
MRVRTGGEAWNWRSREWNGRRRQGGTYPRGGGVYVAIHFLQLLYHCVGRMSQGKVRKFDIHSMPRLEGLKLSSSGAKAGRRRCFVTPFRSSSDVT